MSPRAGAAARPLTPAVRPTGPVGRPTLTALPGGAAGRRGRLETVRAPLQARSALPVLVLCMVILGGALLTVLVLNTQMVRGSYEMSELRGQVGRAVQDTQTIEGQVRAAEATLPERARALGMVEAEAPKILRLPAESPSAAGTAKDGAAPAAGAGVP